MFVSISLFISFWLVLFFCCFVPLRDLDLVFRGVGGFVICFMICASLFCGDSFGGEGIVDLNGGVFGVCQPGTRLISSFRYWRRFGVIMEWSGLSLSLLKVRPLGGLRPKFGSVVICL